MYTNSHELWRDLATITHTHNLQRRASKLHNGITNPGLNKYKHHNRKWVTKLNPFTAVLSALSLWKRPVNAPDLKSLWPFAPFAWTRERVSIKIRCTDSRFVIGLSNILFAGVYMCTFPPRNFTGSGSEGVKLREGDMTDGLSEVRGQSWTTLKIREGDMTEGLSEVRGQSWTTLKIREGVVTEGSFEVRGQSWTTLKIGEGVVWDEILEKTKERKNNNNNKIQPTKNSTLHSYTHIYMLVGRLSCTKRVKQLNTAVNTTNNTSWPLLKLLVTKAEKRETLILTHRMHLTTSKHKVTVFSKGPMLGRKQLSVPDSSPGPFQLLANPSAQPLSMTEGLQGPKILQQLSLGVVRAVNELTAGSQLTNRNCLAIDEWHDIWFMTDKSQLVSNQWMTWQLVHD